MIERPTIAVIYGSTRQGRFCDTVAEWVMRGLEKTDLFEIDVIDPATLRLPERYLEEEDENTKALLSRIGAAEGFVVVTPEYNQGYPAALKHLIDFACEEWSSKPVVFVSYGGVSGGLRAVEQLRLVFAALSAVCDRGGVSLPNPWDRLDGDGRLVPGPSADAALALAAARLAWWVTTLSTGRSRAPLPAAA